jgi:hypothetical protein
MSDPIDALEQFVARIKPFDPRPDETVASIEVRVGRTRGTFELTDRAARALTEVLLRYTDPDDHGACPHCGRPLGRDLYCADCGHIDGIFGATMAAMVERHSSEQA